MPSFLTVIGETASVRVEAFIAVNIFRFGVIFIGKCGIVVAGNFRNVDEISGSDVIRKMDKPVNICKRSVLAVGAPLSHVGLNGLREQKRSRFVKVFAPSRIYQFCGICGMVGIFFLVKIR